MSGKRITEASTPSFMKHQKYRRLRQNPHLRDLVKTTRVDPSQLIQPLFVVDGIRSPEHIPGLTGVMRETESSLLHQIESDLEEGVRKFLLFGVPREKKEGSFSPDFTAKQIESIKKKFGSDLWLAVDVCLCSHTSHGHCGILNDSGDHVLNLESVDELAQFALSYAQAGADCVAPSDMMDGRIAAIRAALDSVHNDSTVILSYSAKFHSKFYGPFRVAANSAPKTRGTHSLQDRATYQIDPARYEDALLSSLRDWKEGADFLMVKPGLPYLDVLYRLSRKIPLPWSIYEVSGEYASIELMAREKLIDGPRAHVEAWTSMIRAGASSIITYGARNGKLWLRGQES